MENSLKSLHPDTFFDNIFTKAFSPDEILNFMINGINLIGIPFYLFQENNFKDFLQKNLEVFQEENFKKLYLLYFQIFGLFIDPVFSNNQIKINIDEIDDFLEQVFFTYFDEDIKGIEEKLTEAHKSSKIKITDFQNLYNYLSIILRNLENELFGILEYDKTDSGRFGIKINEEEWRQKLEEVIIPQNGKDRFEDQILQQLIKKKQKLIKNFEDFKNENPIRNINSLLGLSNIRNVQPQPAKLEEFKYFIRGIKLNIMEGMDIEFKNYTFRLDFEKSFIMKKTICSFLNTKGGRIYIGIRDKDLMVFGTNLTMAMKDEIKREIDDLLNHVHPQVEPSECVTKFIPMKDESLKIIPGFYIIKVIVKRGKINDIYVLKDQNGGISAYFRRDGKNSSLLTPNDLKREIIERNKIEKEKAIKENEEYNARYNDPEPENNVIIVQNFMNSSKNNNFKKVKGNFGRNNINFPNTSSYSQVRVKNQVPFEKNNFNNQNFDTNKILNASETIFSQNFSILGVGNQIPLEKNNFNAPSRQIDSNFNSQNKCFNENQKKFSKFPKNAEIKNKKSVYIRFQNAQNENETDFKNLENYILSLGISFSYQSKPPCSFFFYFNTEESAANLIEILQARKEHLKISIIDNCFDE